MILEKENLNLLLEQLQQGNERAFTSLYDKFSKPLYRNIFRLVKDEDIAEELLQDLFLKVWEVRENIDPEKSFKSFLYKIAENLAYAHFRQIAKNERLVAKLIISSVEYGGNVEDAIIAKENRAMLHEAISSLTPQVKQVYTLCKLEGKSYDEVSEEMGISRKTISGHMVSANKSLKTYLMANSDLATTFIVAQILSHLK